MNTKQFLKYFSQGGFIGLLLVGAFMAFLAFEKPYTDFQTSVVSIDEAGDISTVFAPSTGAVAKSWTLDTITNAENDTLSLGEILASPYQYSYQVRLANVSGTRSIKFYLEQTSATGSTRWMKVDSLTTSGAVINDYLMKSAETWGNKHRIIVDGTGTQVVSYKVDGWLKKTN